MTVRGETSQNDKLSSLFVSADGPEPVTVTGAEAVEVHDTVLLKCAAASVPPASFTWKFNGTVTAVKTAEFSIEDPKYKNSGTYMCEAYNAVTGKTTSASHFLSVKGKMLTESTTLLDQELYLPFL